MRRKGTVSVRFDPEKTIAKMNGRLKLAHANRVFSAMKIATRVAIDATPMWSGDTRANYRWSIGRKGNDYSPFNQGTHWRSQPRTASMTSADSRSMAALEAMRSAVYKDPYQKFVLYNNVQYEGRMTIRDLEYGTLTGTPHMMMAKADQALRARLSNVR